ncbi:hypothetical protein [Streptomyces sp. NPDC055749]
MDGTNRQMREDRQAEYDDAVTGLHGRDLPLAGGRPSLARSTAEHS